jgi:hypothetical protein
MIGSKSTTGGPNYSKSFNLAKTNKPANTPIKTKFP